MDALKALTAKKKAERSTLVEKTGKSWVRGGDVVEERKKRYLEEKAELEAETEREKRRKKEQLDLYFKQKMFNAPKKEEDEKIDEPMMFDDDEAEPPVPLLEIIERLRDINHPIFLFGETRMQSYKRLLLLERNRNKDYSEDLKATSGTNTHLEEMQKEEKGEAIEDDSEHEDEMDELDVGEDENARNQSYLHKWAKRLLKEWQNDLARRPEADRMTATGKFETGQYRQSRRDLKPLLKKLKHRQLNAQITSLLFQMASMADKREYRKAGEKYMELSIGNAAWPVGVTQTTIHSRAGMTKISDGGVAHILGDETTRKFMMVIKRLLTLAERLNPPEKR
eukprot:GEMP01039328.1.p1 GENE.GEMP01039328.1~~GEMP01039328.1.p1  ORF type:complete len:338 (+),score=98.43 GEMP01039328.1:10-1023(+)